MNEVVAFRKKWVLILSSDLSELEKVNIKMDKKTHLQSAIWMGKGMKKAIKITPE